MFEIVGLPARRTSDYPHQLSGGQRQRVLIALALSCNPRILIADEPTTALDVMVQAQVLELVEHLQRELALSMIFITHDLSTLSYVCQRTAVMYAGRIVEEGGAEEVFARPSHPYTAALAAAFPLIGDHSTACGRPGSAVTPESAPERVPVPPALCSGAPGLSRGRRRPLARERARAACVHVLGGSRP